MKNIIGILLISLIFFTNCQQEIIAGRRNLMSISSPSSSSSFTNTTISRTTTNLQKITCTYDGKYQSTYFDLSKCDEEAGSCYHYLLEEKKATDFTIINWLYEGMEVEISGRGLYKAKAKDNVYFELQENIEISVVTQYQGLRNDIGKKNKQYLVFSAQSNLTSTTVFFLLEQDKLEKINPSLKGLAKNTTIKITGYTKGIETTKGNQYVELTDHIKMSL